MLSLGARAPAFASGHYGGGGGGGSAEVVGKCLRWVKIDAGPDGGGTDLGSSGVTDAGVSDGGVDGGVDGGTVAGHIGEKCVERAGLFGCAMADHGPPSERGAGWALLAGLAVLWAAGRRRMGARAVRG